MQNRLLGTLSKGYRQRVGLADAMLADPPILILDEPTSGLDPVQINETLNTIKELGGQHTVLLSTHILTEVEKVCERVIIIDKGRIELDDTMKSIAGREPTLRGRGPRPGRGGDASSSRSSRNSRRSTAKPGDGDLTAFEIKTKGGKDLREELARRLSAKGWGIRQLDVQRVSLEALLQLGGHATA